VCSAIVAGIAQYNISLLTSYPTSDFTVYVIDRNLIQLSECVFPCNRKSVCRVVEAIALAAKGEVELILLDRERLQTQHLALLIQAMTKAGPKSILTALSLEDNLLTDESCGILCTALQDLKICPVLLNINLSGNAGISPLGLDQLKDGLTNRPDLKVLVKWRAVVDAGRWTALLQGLALSLVL
jgi:hypothetical protein